MMSDMNRGMLRDMSRDVIREIIRDVIREKIREKIRGGVIKNPVRNSTRGRVMSKSTHEERGGVICLSRTLLNAGVFATETEIVALRRNGALSASFLEETSGASALTEKMGLAHVCGSRELGVAAAADEVRLERRNPPYRARGLFIYF